MTAFNTLFKNELRQSVTDKKIVWLPLVMALLGISQPLVLAFLPEIMAQVGGIESAGIIIQKINYSGAEVLNSTLSSQFDQLGLFIIIVAFANVVLADKKNGMLDYLLTKPVSGTAYILSKWAAACLITAVSLAVGFGLSCYYTAIYFSSPSVQRTAAGLAVYLLWLMLVLGVTVFASTVCRGQAVATIIPLGAAVSLQLIAGLELKLNRYNPAGVSRQAANLLLGDRLSPDFKVQAAVLVMCLCGLMGALCYLLAGRYVSTGKEGET